MNQYLTDIKTYITDHKTEFISGAGATFGIALVITLIGLFIYNNQSKIIYTPANACDLFTLKEAQEQMGAKALHSNNQPPMVKANTATSKCGYTDGNPQQGGMIVAAVIVRSGINDEGVEQNKNEFTAGWPSKNTETVKDIGERAYFNTERGQLNVLQGRDWYIFSYGVGDSPESNTVEKTVELARKVIR